MKFYYLQVDRIDADTLAPIYVFMTNDAENLDERVGGQMDFYRRQGFQILHFPDRPTYKTARRASDGVKLEMIVIQRDTPLATYCNLSSEDFEDGDPAIH